MDNRQRILEAASRVYAQHGFRGATTRLIAQEAGVNEVTIFRIFGSKSGLFDVLLHAQIEHAPAAALPQEPRDPRAELTEWASGTLAQMHASRSLLRKMIGEMEERPTAAITACEGSRCAAQMLADYVERLRGSGARVESPAEVWTAVSMFVGALVGDALCREIMPASFPQPEEEAPALYVSAFLRAIGLSAAAEREFALATAQ
jgi:AcrR family transcriptional regulator